MSQRIVRAAMGSVLIALGCLALVAVHETVTGGSRVVLASENALDPMFNPMAGTGKGGFMAEDEETPLYAREAPDQPVKAGDWAWATTTTEDGAITHGHNADWIYQDGWKNPGGVLKGSASNYYNEYDLDENMQPQADIQNEQSLPDHSTSMPYTYLSGYGTTNGPDGVNQILDVDPYIAQSNGIY